MSEQNNSVVITYGAAAWMVIIGVLVSWFFLKQNTVQAHVELPEIPAALQLIAADDTSQQGASLTQKAEVAYAAGRITRPKGDSALDYYRQQLVIDPTHESALDGVSRVTAFLVNGAETALRREDWGAARDLAEEAREIKRDHPAVASILDRIGKHDQIVRLSDLAHEQISSGNLTTPKGANALASYREILSLNPTHAGAKQGIELIAQRLASLAQSEAFADRTDRARELIKLARSIAPSAPGIDAAQQLTDEWSNLTKDQAVKDDLMAAANASQSGRLLTSDEPGQLGALDLYKSALEKDADSEAALAGIEYVVSRVEDRTWIQLANEEFELAEQAITGLATTDTDLSALKQELDFLKRRQAYRAGIFGDEDFVTISQLTIKRQVQPSVSGKVEGGTVELQFTVNEQGDVQDVLVVDAGNQALGNAAESAIARWKFAPYELQGRTLPVRTALILRIET